MKKLLISISLLIAFVYTNAQIYTKPNNSYGTISNRASIDSTLFFPTGCGVPTDTTWLNSQGFTGAGQKMRKFALYGDSCGNKAYLWIPSLQSWQLIGSGAGIDTLYARGDSAFYKKTGVEYFAFILGTGGGSTNTSVGGKYRIAITGTNNVKTVDTAFGTKLDSTTVANVVKFGVDSSTVSSKAYANYLRDSLANLITAKVTNFKDVQFLGYGNTASHPTTGKGIYYNTDSTNIGVNTNGPWFYYNAGVAINLTPIFKQYIFYQGATGYVTFRASNDTLYSRLLRDSLDFHLYLVGDSALVGFVQAHDTTTTHALASKYDVDTMRLHIYQSVYFNYTGVGAGTCSNCTVTFDAVGRATGYSSGTITSTFYRPEDFGGGTGVADNRGPIQSCDSAANADPNKKTCYLGAGTYQVQMASLKSGGPSIGPIHLYSNTTITGAGLQTAIKLVAPPGGATFSPVSAPTTFTSNTNFYSLFEIDSQTNVVVQNMLLNGTLNVQINKDVSGTDPVGAPDPYKNPQDGTTTANVQTDGIKIIEGSNNFIYNVEVDSFVGYGVHVVRALNTDIFHINSFGNINGNVYFADSNAAGNPVVQQCAGSILHNSKIIGSYADNVRVIASYIRIEENEIAWSKPRPVSASVNFANLYLQSNLGSGVLGVISTLNYMHDASAFDIDQFQVDTVFSTYKGPSNIITNNTLNNGGAGGVQVALPYVKMANNTLLNEGIRSDGFIDSGSQCHCGVHIATSGWGADIQNNQFLDRNKLMIGGMLTMQTTMPNLTFANNTAVGMTAFSNSVATLYAGPPFNNIHGNQYIDTGGVYHAMFTLDNGGALHISPNAGTNNALPQAVTIDDFTADGQLYIYHLGNSSNIRKGIIGFQSQNGLEMKVLGDENGDYLGVGRGTIVGREFSIQDGQTSVSRWGIDSSGSIYTGPGTATGTSGVGWSVKMQQPVALSTTFPLGVDINYPHTSGSTNFTLEAALSTAIGPGFSGTTGYTVAGIFKNTNTANTGSIAGNGGTLGHYGIYSESFGAATGANGTNFGAQYLAGNAMRNVGFIAEADWNQFNNASSVSIGGLIYSKRANSSATELGLYIGMQNGAPTVSNAGLIVDNGVEAIPIQKWQVGNVDKVVVDQNAKIQLIQSPDSGAINGGVLVRDATSQYVKLAALQGYMYLPTDISGSRINISAITIDSAIVQQIGNIISVTGELNVTPTAGSSNTTEIFLVAPVTSNFSGHNCWGNFTISGNQIGGTVQGNPSGAGQVELTFISTITSSISLFYHYTYKIE